jgi:hypothetical protein
MDMSIMPECYADTLLIQTLVPPKVRYNHKFGCFKVEAEMKLGKLKDRFAVGIIDNDKNQIRYLAEFAEVDKVEGSLILWRHSKKEKHHYLIQICPALEKWILNLCEEEGINVADFGLRKDLDGLKEFSKSRRSLNEKSLVDLFSEICQKIENINVRKLKFWITLLKDKNYNVDINQLKNA